VALDASTQDSLAKLTASLKERATVGENPSSTYIMWAFFTAVTMIGAIAVCFTPQADRRFSEAMTVPARTAEPPPQMMARVETPPPVQAPPQVIVREEPDAELLARLKLLEEQLDNVTGSIAKLPPPAPPAPPPPSGVTPTEAPKQVKTAPVAPAQPAPQPEPQEMVVQVPAPAPAPAPVAEPVTTASVPTTNFGLDLGSEASFGALRARWDTLKREHTELSRLSPRISVRDNKGRVELRLVAGPFTNAADAARVCAALFVKGVSCDGGLFDGQRLPPS
jgi:hypothetical protein